MASRPGRVSLPLEVTTQIALLCSGEDVIFHLPPLSRSFYHACRDPRVLRHFLRKEMPAVDADLADSVMELLVELESFFCEQDRPGYWLRWLISLHSLMRDSYTEAVRAQSSSEQQIGWFIGQSLTHLLEYLPHALVLEANATISRRIDLIRLLASFYFNVPHTRGSELRASLLDFNNYVAKKMLITLIAIVLEQQEKVAAALTDRHEALGGKSIPELIACHEHKMYHNYGVFENSRPRLDLVQAPAHCNVFEILISSLNHDGALIYLLDLIIILVQNKGRASFSNFSLPEFNGTNFPYFSRRPSVNKFRHPINYRKEVGNSQNGNFDYAPVSLRRRTFVEREVNRGSDQYLERTDLATGLSRFISIHNPHGDFGSNEASTAQMLEQHTLEFVQDSCGIFRMSHLSYHFPDVRKGRKHNLVYATQGYLPRPNGRCFISLRKHTDGEPLRQYEEVWYGEDTPFGISGLAGDPWVNYCWAEDGIQRAPRAKGLFWFLNPP